MTVPARRRAGAPRPRHRAPRRQGAVLLRLVLALLAAGTGTVVLLVPGSAPPADAAPASGPVVLAARPPAAGVVPLRVRVPAIGVDSGLVDLGLDAAGALEAPAGPALAGWYAQGPAPGDVGPAVLAGHVDSRVGPAVFFRLQELSAGDEVLVDRSDGTTARFTVDRVERHPKDAFPTDAVYGPTADAQLRLVTCGGDFDRAARSYADNVVVFARAA
ncbi:Sortase family protein [Geodermatophilus obscurus]|uniref:Sortase family protein n=1 Tax=Geodermatophilus obscurus TaxID=1861 RepID=A0A1I5GR31_9ACTN|nr:class F sortase [Geodermatophilus obscurus]SFO38316.1 Sortase family protein [Geodermatophilus obscurus]